MTGLRVDNARVSYPGATVPALDGVSLELPRAQVLAVIGPSGCGKSTLLRAVAGLQRLDHGRITFDDDDLAHTPTHRRDFALMFQEGQLFGHLDVVGNVGYALKRRRTPREQIAARVEELLDLVGLAGFEERRPATLSGGQQQRVALARALAAKPRLLLLDEPLSALDRSLRARLAADLRGALLAEGTTALFVTHDHDEALTVADDLAVMRDGRIVQSGAAAEVWRKPSDPDTAVFLGYTTRLSPAEAVVLGLNAQEWALRRSGLQVSSDGDVPARITRLSAAGEAFHLLVRVPGIDRALEALAPLTESSAPVLGDEVGLRVERAAAVAF